jgi:hypothetical protein
MNFERNFLTRNYFSQSHNYYGIYIFEAIRRDPAYSLISIPEDRRSEYFPLFVKKETELVPETKGFEGETHDS